MTVHAPETWPAVSVIVPVYNDPEHLARCITAILAQDYPGVFDLLVIDNGSKPPVRGHGSGLTTTPGRTARTRVTVLREPSPGSYRARNTGLGFATGELIAFTDADCEPHAGWLRAAVTALTNDLTLDAVGGRVRIVSVYGQRSIAELYEMAVAFPQEEYIVDAGYAATANLVTRASTLTAVGRFSETLRSGGDVEWGQRLHRLGFRLGYCSEAVVDHPARNHAEVMSKVRRTTGGSRDRDASWQACLLFCARFVVPPRKRILQIVEYRDQPITLLKRLQVIGYATMLNWTAVYYRLQLQITQSPSAR